MASRPTKAEMQELKDDLGRVYTQLAIQRADIADREETERRLTHELQAANEGWRLATERCADLHRTLKDLEKLNEQLTRERDKAKSDLEQFRKRVTEMCQEHQTEREEWHHEREILRGIIQMLAGRAK
jgi:chromosome segregation ATPase